MTIQTMKISSLRNSTNLTVTFDATKRPGTHAARDYYLVDVLTIKRENDSYINTRSLTESELDRLSNDISLQLLEDEHNLGE